MRTGKSSCATRMNRELKTLRDEFVDGECRLWLCGVAGFQIAFDVFSQHIAFEIYRVADFFAADVGVRVGVGNHGNFGDTAVPPSNRKADSVNGDRALRNNISREGFGNFDAIPPVFAFGRAQGRSGRRIPCLRSAVARG